MKILMIALKKYSFQWWLKILKAWIIWIKEKIKDLHYKRSKKNDGYGDEDKFKKELRKISVLKDCI